MSRNLDRRIVAVMFTDMLGYTALMQADERIAIDKRDRYVAALERHHDTFDGTIVQRLGDGSLSMFPSALDAVQAAIAVQRELAPLDVPVRVGVHVGEVIVEPERLTGDAVNIAARIESFAVPGGVMLSDSAYDQIKNRGDVDVVHLGHFRLKNVGRPFELYAVSADGIVVPERAALEGKGEAFAAVSSNLPAPTATLLGRAEELEALGDLVRAHRVVTISGPGGVGKTRLLVELGRRLAPQFLDGVAFIPMADVVDAADFVPAVADALDVKEAEERTLAEGIVALIEDRKALMLLDNLEQVVAAAPEVAALVASCPELRIVTTSRMPLRIAAEREYQLAPLAIPAAVELFVERARATAGSFDLTDENAAAVAAVCRRLDGLPLALELAAARMRILSPGALLDRLDHALNVLTSGPRDTPGRQQTLRATIDWSHSLLSDVEQRLFRRLAVFAGGFTVDDVEAVCAEPGESVLDELESLVEKALVQADAGGSRLRLLQTIGEYARERLEEAGEADAAEMRHATRYAALAREIRDGIEGADQIGSVERGIAAEANLQGALETSLLAAAAGDADACEQGLQMTGDLWMYWHIRGKNLTAHQYGSSFVAADRAGRPTVGGAGALIAMGLGSWMSGRYERANEEWGEAHRLAEAVGAERELCLAAFCLALGQIVSDPEAGLAWTSDGFERSAALGFDWGIAISLTVSGMVHAMLGDQQAAQGRFTQALEIQQRLGDREGGGMSLGGLAQLAATRGEPADALDLYRQSLAAFEEVGDRGEEARILSEMAWTYLRNDDPVLARRCFLQAVQAHTDVASVRGVGLSLIGLAATEAFEQRPERAVQIAAAAAIYAQEEGIVVFYGDDSSELELVDRARASLSPDEVERATELGRRLSIKDALDLARSPEWTVV